MMAFVVQRRQASPMRLGAFTLLFLVAAAHLMMETSAASTVARQRSPQRQVSMEPAFANAGKNPGLEIWRIEDFKPVPYPKNQYGKFYSGDSYIVLNTRVNKKGEKFWDIHFWLGSQTTQDEAGAAAILSVQLDDQLGGDPVQHREKQDHESQAFLSYFKSGVRYEAGGVSSGFRHVDPQQQETRLFQVKGSRNIRVKEVDPNFASLNKGDCFILDKGSKIFVYVGSKAKRVEKLKATAAANQIRDQDHGGKPRVTIVDDYSPQSDFDEFFAALGGGSRDKVPEEAAGGDDATFETSEEKAVSLYRVSDASGSLKIQPVGTRPLDQSLLDENDVFILDTGDIDVFVWIGRKATAQEKRESMKKADAYLTAKKRPAWTHVERVVQGAETAAFTQYFRTWQGYGETRRRIARATREPRLIHALLRPGTTKFRLEEVGDFDQDDLNIDDLMILDVPEAETVYLWIGEGTDEEEQAKSDQLIQDYVSARNQNTKIVKVNQGEEPEDFKALFPDWNPELWLNKS